MAPTIWPRVSPSIAACRRNRPSSGARRSAGCFPRLYAAASLKPRRVDAAGNMSFPRLYAATSLKREQALAVIRGQPRFPRLYAAASLKLLAHLAGSLAATVFSAALCRGLIEAVRSDAPALVVEVRQFSAALCRGLIEAQHIPEPGDLVLRQAQRGFPRLYAAASLKLISTAPGRRRFPRLLTNAAALKRRWRA